MNNSFLERQEQQLMLDIQSGEIALFEAFKSNPTFYKISLKLPTIEDICRQTNGERVKNNKNNLTMEQKLIILKDIKSLNLDKGDIMNYNESSKSFILEVNTSDTDVSKQGVYTNSYSKRIEISEEKAAQLIEKDSARLELIYPEKEPELNTPEEFEDKLYNSSEAELKAILAKLETLSKQVDELYNIYTY